jgi:histidinol phosphatase-like PHP family hydrolase
MNTLTNRAIAELLARQAEASSEMLQKALRRAARLAFLWPIEAGDLAAEGRSLTELPGIGPHLQRVIQAWLDKPPVVPPPEPARSGFITMAEARLLLQQNPKWTAKLRGDLQMHTTWSDGSGSIHEMAQQGVNRGYEYIAITDHSVGLKIAGGITEAELRQQGKEISAENGLLSSERAALRVLHSLELNLNPRGEGDMNSEVLAELDLVLGSFHSALRRKEDQTPRYLAAVRNPDIQILGHPRGRVFNYRLGLNADWPRVFAEAAALDKAVEIDAYPDRQDLSVELLKEARAAGVRISIGTDAHSPDQLGFVELGLASALLAKIPAERILNFMPREELRGWAAAVRAGSRSGIKTTTANPPRQRLRTARPTCP